MAGTTSAASLKCEDVRECPQYILELLTVFLGGGEINTDDTGLLFHLGVEDLAKRIFFELLYHFVDFLYRLLKVSSKLNAHNVIATIARITSR